MKPILFFLMIILAAAPAIHAQTQEEIDEALKFYPLQVGNYWEYRYASVDEQFPVFNDTTYYSIEVIADTTLSNGVKYQVLQSVNMGMVYLPHHEVEASFNEHGQRVNKYFERIDSLTANIYQWKPIEGNPFHEVMIDSLLLQPTEESSAVRWPFGVYTIRIPQMDEVLVFGSVYEAISMTMIDAIPVFYVLASGLGIAYIESGEGFSYGKIDAIYFRDHEGNEYGDAVHVNTPVIPEIPQTSALHANYPNPFNPATTIPFELSEASQVRLEVYDMLGRRVALLVNETHQPGRHTAVFDAGSISSGMYIARLQTNDLVFSRKMLLVK